MSKIDRDRLLQEFEAYLLDSALAPATVVNYLSDLRAFLRWSERRKGGAAFSLNPTDIEEYCLYLREDKDHTPATINRRIQTLRKFYELAVSRGWAAANPAEDVCLLREPPSGRSRSLTMDDVNRLLAAVRRSQGRWADRDKAIISMLVGTGLKLGELIELRLSDIDLESSEPCLHVRDIDGSRGRVVPLEREVSEALRSYMSARGTTYPTDYLYINRDGKPLSPRSVQRLLNRYARAAGLDKITTQALRYIYARQVYEKSKSLRTVAHLLGHRHLATTIRYLRPGTLPGDQPLADHPTE